MHDLVLSLNNNKVKLSLLVDGAFLAKTADVDSHILNDTKIVDVEALTKIIDDLLRELTPLSKNKLRLNYVLEPEDCILRFITINKRDGDVSEQISNEIKNRLPGMSLDNFYYSYEKIAPFLFQFCAIEKTFFDQYLSLANSLQIELKKAVPWILYLPHFLKLTDPSILIAKVGKTSVIALTELGGIFYTGVTEELSSFDELQKIIHQLSFYKRTQPINSIYTLAYDMSTLDPAYNVTKVQLPTSEPDSVIGYETNTLIHFLVDNDSHLPYHIDFINLLPLPVVATRSNALVYVGTGIGTFVLMLGVVGGLYFFKPGEGKGPSAVSGNPVVLSDTSQTTQTTSTAPETPRLEQNLKREDLKIRVENGAGVPGLAARSKDFLAKLNYKILEIDTSDTSTAPTILRFKKSKASYSSLVQADIKSSFPSVKVEDTLPETAAFDLLFIAGTSSKL